MLGLLKDELKD